MRTECKACGGIMECIIRFVSMGSVHWCSRCGTLAVGSYPTDWKVPTSAKLGSENKVRSEPPHPTYKCEYESEVPECRHPDLPPGNPGTFPCHQQNCPWPERQKDNDWWEGHPGKHVKGKHDGQPPHVAAGWDPN